jgi:hypothetical protein
MLVKETTLTGVTYQKRIKAGTTRYTVIKVDLLRKIM